MDPNANINEQREIAQRMVDHDGEGMSSLLADGQRLAELVLALDGWRASGGFEPSEGVPTPVRGAVYEVKGTITLPDGSASEFVIERDTGWQRSGADIERLSKTIALLSAMTEAVRAHFPDDDNNTGADSEPSPDPDWMNP